MDSTPLFGDEHAKTKKILIGVFIGVICAITAITILLTTLWGVFSTPLRWQHFVYSVIIVSVLVFDIVLVIIYARDYTIDPKFKFIILFVTALLIACCINALLYAWFLSYPGSGCHGDFDLYRFSDNICMENVRCLTQPKLTCVGFNSVGNSQCGSFNATEGSCVIRGLF